MKTDYIQFRKKLDDDFFSMGHRNSVAYQLVDLTDLFQKIAAIYDFARKNENTALQNPILFQIIESALLYGVCMQVRRLADGRQQNEISIFKTAQEIKSNCRNWSRSDFITWDGKPYDSSELRATHKNETDRIVSEMMQRGEMGGWLPIGAHEEVDRRHYIFDLLSSTQSNERSEADVWNRKITSFILSILEASSGEVVAFANRYLAHRVHLPTERAADFDVSLEKIEHSVTALWKCYNIVDAIFRDNYMTPDIIHSLDSFRNLGLPIANQELESALVHSYEAIKERMETATSMHSRVWQSEFLSKNEAAE